MSLKPDGPPCFLCGKPSKREEWRHHFTGEVFATVYHCPHCHSTRDVEDQAVTTGGER